MKRSLSLPKDLHLQENVEQKTKKAKVSTEDISSEATIVANSEPPLPLKKERYLALLKKIEEIGYVSMSGIDFTKDSKLIIYALDGSRSMEGEDVVCSAVDAMSALKDELLDAEKGNTYVMVTTFHGDGSKQSYCLKKATEITETDIEEIYSNESGTPLHVHMCWLLKHVITKEASKNIVLNVVTDGADWPKRTGFAYDIFTDEGKEVQKDLQRYVDKVFSERAVNRHFVTYKMDEEASSEIVRQYTLRNEESQDVSEGGLGNSMRQRATDSMYTLRIGSN